MLSAVTVLAGLAVVCSFALPAAAEEHRAALGMVVDTCFVPGDRDCEAVVVGEVGRAHREVLVQGYSFTAPNIVKALADAKRRGVDVRVILDARETKTQKQAIAVDTLLIAKVSVLIDRDHAIAHNKVVIVDGATVETGSYNFSAAARDRNAENVVVLEGREVADRYRRNWLDHARHSIAYGDWKASEK